jgi:hypothetical protein
MRSSPRKQLLVAVISWGLLALGFLIVRSGNTQSLPNKTSQEPDPVITAIRKGGLREGARIKGHYVATERINGWLMYDLESLANNSVAVIIGTPSSASSRLTASGEGIVTEYKVRIDQVFKGTLKRDELINVITPGGKVTFENGTSAEIRISDLGPIKEQRRYVFFLRTSNDSLEAFDLTGGGQGLFELSSSDSRVKPLGGEKDFVQKHKNQSVDDFIGEVERAATKYPATLPCCN